MKGMTTQERYNDISRISGMSEEVVRRVLGAEKQSILASLKRGERATIIGRCAIKPELRSKLVVGGELRNYIKLSSSVAASLEESLGDMEDFEEDIDDEEEQMGIRINQIQSLV